MTLNEQAKKLRIVFMGTPEFAVASLDALVRAGGTIVGVITAPDKPAGRGMELQQSAVKKYALEHQLPLLQPEKLRDPDFLDALRNLKADLQICVAFRMLPEVVWNMPPMGTINLHGSLLPQYRGAAPINWAVINGEKETGVTTFKLQHEIDTGHILLQDHFPVNEDDTAGSVHDKMKDIGANLLVATVEGLANGSLTEIPQPGAAALRHAPKIFTETCLIDFSQPVEKVYDLVRGLSPYPGAFTFLNQKKLKIFKASVRKAATDQQPGTFQTDAKTYLSFVCTNGFLDLKELQLEGKKRMAVEDFLRGYQF
ncbi:methionyl-tRNA formyltransferase [Niabella drilacis]|uniref:Methionyl-tRNA formyltransferase n=1 Tax=Niabella drilacis (strain DSM 25811 / CCM 8410 / CCUG 62505 / LMG 26954 / E90) TaxID=1285928 RepID=A0A1G6Y8P9_NIADE|nr:methionyl-tRNA formyltransferase [Niabella drilacis]SDD86672.1 methionyl-tRNA formyltransferase [Niabella drilacis]